MTQTRIKFFLVASFILSDASTGNAIGRSNFSPNANKSASKQKAKGNNSSRETKHSRQEVFVSAKAIKLVTKMRESTKNVRSKDLQLLCSQCLGTPRINGTHISFPLKVNGQLMTFALGKGSNSIVQEFEVKKALYLINQLKLTKRKTKFRDE